MLLSTQPMVTTVSAHIPDHIRPSEGEQLVLVVHRALRRVPSLAPLQLAGVALKESTGDVALVDVQTQRGTQGEE